MGDVGPLEEKPEAPLNPGGGSCPLSRTPTNVDWQEPVVKRFICGLSILRHRKMKYKEVAQEEAFSVYDQDVISNIPDLYRVPLTCHLRFTP